MRSRGIGEHEVVHCIRDHWLLLKMNEISNMLQNFRLISFAFIDILTRSTLYTLKNRAVMGAEKWHRVLAV